MGKRIHGEKEKKLKKKKDYRSEKINKKYKKEERAMGMGTTV